MSEFFLLNYHISLRFVSFSFDIYLLMFLDYQILKKYDIFLHHFNFFGNFNLEEGDNFGFLKFRIEVKVNIECI